MKKISSKIILGFLLAGLIPLITSTIVTERISNGAVEHLTKSEFLAIRDIKKGQIETYFSERISDINVLSALSSDLYQGESGIEGAIARKVVGHQNFFEYYMAQYGYYDLFLINPEGEVFYTVAKEADYQSNLLNGPYKDSNLGELFRKVTQQENPALVDFTPYAPSNGDPAAFIAKRIMNGNELLGVVALQIPLDPINAIMQTRSGMGETGESYLIGSDLLMRSDSYLDPKNHSVLASFKNPKTGKVNTEAARQVIAGKTAVETIIDYNGNPVVSAYAPLNIPGLNWAILAEIDVAEAFIPIYNIQKLALIIGAVMAMIIIIFALFYARLLSRPILQLTETMKHAGTDFDFSKSCLIQAKDEIGQAADAFNDLLKNISLAFSDVNSTMTDISSGKFDSRITSDLKGDLGILKDSVNASANSVDFTMQALGNVMNAISNGDFSARMDEKIPGQFRTMVDNAMQSMDTAVSELGAVITKLSEGDFNGRISTELKGDMDKLKTNVNQSVDQLETAMTEIIEAIVAQSAGDLTVQVNGRYDGQLERLKTAFNEGGTKLNQVMNSVMQSADLVSQASQEVASGSMDLNQRTQSQAASLEETAAAMEEITSTIKHNADNARTADQLSMNARNQAQQGQAVMLESIEAINEISDSSSQISDIIGLIDSIAFQTNLLALNAAVEAARAGEHGRGFAVVASEVRNLAGKSADAAKDIKGLIDRSTNSIKHGSEKIEQTSHSLRDINESILQVSSIVSEISAASQEQQIGVEQVNQAIAQIDQTTQQNAALVEETTAAAESMNNESKQLKSTVSNFKTSGNLLLQ